MERLTINHTKRLAKPLAVSVSVRYLSSSSLVMCPMIDMWESLDLDGLFLVMTRAKIIQGYIDEVLEATGTTSPRFEIAKELENRALDDEYFTARALYPNADFYSGVIYEALGLPKEMVTVMFAVLRTSGWMASGWSG